MEDHVEGFEFPGVFGWFADNCNGYPEKQHLEVPEGESSIRFVQHIFDECIQGGSLIVG